MDRSLRRHQQAVARVRKLRIIRQCWGSRHGVKRPWRQLARAVMNEPGWWVHEFMTVPARRRERRFEHLVTAGRDPDSINWPDNRKPHKYYW
jgi:hypothetical protein